MSLVATFVSGITLLGTSTEIYIHGTQYAFILIGPAMMGVFMHFVIIPVFYDLKVVSMFEVIAIAQVIGLICDIFLSQVFAKTL